MLVGSTLLFLTKVAIAHKSFESGEQDEAKAQAAAAEAASQAAEAAAAGAEGTPEGMSDLDRDIAAKKLESESKLDPI